ncbi:MAG: XRE family transcriptional regulator [Proteobacteria bacterium]|nr:XRE family transcriptional regulator [Pseudomonadota bacterium]
MVSKNKHIGSSFDDFLEEEGLLVTSEIEAVKRIIAYLLQQKIDAHIYTKTALAHELGTSRSGLERILDPENTSITLNTLARAAELTGKKIYISIK